MSALACPDILQQRKSRPVRAACMLASRVNEAGSLDSGAQNRNEYTTSGESRILR